MGKPRLFRMAAHFFQDGEISSRYNKTIGEKTVSEPMKGADRRRFRIRGPEKDGMRKEISP